MNTTTFDRVFPALVTLQYSIVGLSTMAYASNVSTLLTACTVLNGGMGALFLTGGATFDESMKKYKPKALKGGLLYVGAAGMMAAWNTIH